MTDLSSYLSRVAQTFYCNDQVHDFTFDHGIDKSILTESLSKKEELQYNWAILKSQIQRLGQNVKDVTFSSNRHSMTCVVYYDADMNVREGFIVSVSVPFSLIGIVYYAFVPDGSGGFEVKYDYRPLHLNMSQRSKLILELALSNFPKFKAFDSNIASYKINLIEIDGLDYRNIDLWKVLFTVNLQIVM